MAVPPGSGLGGAGPGSASAHGHEVAASRAAEFCQSDSERSGARAVATFRRDARQKRLSGNSGVTVAGGHSVRNADERPVNRSVRGWTARAGAVGQPDGQQPARTNHIHVTPLAALVNSPISDIMSTTEDTTSRKGLLAPLPGPPASAWFNDGQRRRPRVVRDRRGQTLTPARPSGRFPQQPAQPLASQRAPPAGPSTAT